MTLQGTIDDWRDDHLEKLADLERSGITDVEWCAAGDEHVCPSCRARNGRVFTIAQMPHELKGEFCCPGDPDERCRCVIIATSKRRSNKDRCDLGKAKPESGCLVVLFLVVVVALAVGKISL